MVSFYFLAVVFFLVFFVLNLFLAVISDSFETIQQKESNEEDKIKRRKKEMLRQLNEKNAVKPKARSKAMKKMEVLEKKLKE